MASITVNSEDLIAAVKRVFPHCATASQNVPVLENIKLEVVWDRLILSATDRYTLIEAAVFLVEGENESFTALVNGKQLKTLLPALKAGSRVTITESLEQPGAAFNGTLVYGNSGEYPATRKLWPDEVAEMSANVCALSAVNVKKLSALPQQRHEKDTPLVFCQAPNAEANKPVVVVFGDMARVLLMPMRTTGVPDGYGAFSRAAIAA